MIKRPVFIIFLLCTLFFVAAAHSEDAAADVVVVERFSAADKGKLPEGWKTFEFSKVPRATIYTVENEGDDYFLKAESESSASVVYKRVSVDTKKHPLLKWRWKIEEALKTADEKTREGDDHAARLFVVFEFEYANATAYEKLKYHMAALVIGRPIPGNTIGYTWANAAAKGESYPSPYTGRLMMICIESGDELRQKWVEESVDVYQDYKRLFGSEPPQVIGIAVMTDTDAAKGRATGYYDDILFAGVKEAK